MNLTDLIHHSLLKQGIIEDAQRLVQAQATETKVEGVVGALEVEEEEVMAGTISTDMATTGETIEEDMQTEQMVTVVGFRDV